MSVHALLDSPLENQFYTFFGDLKAYFGETL